MSKKVCWGIIGAGAIANAFADGVVRSETGKLVAVGSRSLEKAEAFAEKWGVARAHGSYEALLADESVQAVYIATPHPMHPEWAIKAAEAGKHILLEKPMAINSYLAETILEAVVENNVFFMEAYMYRCHPQTAKLVELIREKAIGDVNAMEASFTFRSEYSPNSRLWNNDLAGGGILDVGGYATSITRLVAGAAVGKPFADPVTVCGVGKLHEESGVDCWAVGAMKFDNGIVGTIRTGIGLAADNSFRVFGSEGSIVVPDPFAASRQGSQNGRIIVRKNGAPEQIIEIPSELTSYVYEADVCGRAILAKRTEAEAPAMTWEDSLGNLRAQDQWRAAIGLTYESEKTKSLGSLTPANRPLALNRNAPAPDMMLPGLDKPMSRLVFGVDNQSTMVHASAVFDDYFMRGGNVFDTAFVYGFKRSHLLGQWIKARGVEDKVVVIAKGAHTPYCNPEDLVLQLDEQLRWLGLDSVDIYMMHRDNPELPVSGFINTLNELVEKGKIKIFGGSNWSLDRVKKANAYARRKGLQGFSVLSNNLSLAEMVNPVWDGCLHVHDAADRAYLRRTQIALFPWSSQARGFFVPSRAHPDLKEDESLVHSWYSEDNFKRQARAIELAEKKNCEPINIALAWVLHQRFPVFPLIGPRHLAETRSSFAALDVKLSQRECKYLNLEI